MTEILQNFEVILTLLNTAVNNHVSRNCQSTFTNNMNSTSKIGSISGGGIVRMGESPYHLSSPDFRRE